MKGISTFTMRIWSLIVLRDSNGIIRKYIEAKQTTQQGVPKETVPKGTGSRKMPYPMMKKTVENTKDMVNAARVAFASKNPFSNFMKGKQKGLSQTNA